MSYPSKSSDPNEKKYVSKTVLQLGIFWLIGSFITLVVLILTWIYTQKENQDLTTLRFWIFCLLGLWLVFGSIFIILKILKLNRYIIELHQLFESANKGNYEIRLKTDPEDLSDSIHVILSELSNLASANKSGKAINRRLNEIRQTIKEVSEGNFHARAIVGEDSAGKVGEELNIFLEKLEPFLINTRRLNHQFGTVTGEIKSATAEIENGSRQTRRQLSEVTEKVEELATQLERISGQLEEATQSSKYGNESLSGGKSLMRRCKESLDSRMHKLMSTSRQTRQLFERLEELIQLTDRMNQLSQKIEMLSLNISLETSRSGGGGDGVILLTQEMGNLSQQSGEIIQNIFAVASIIQSDVKTAHIVLEDTGEAIKVENEDIDKLEDMLAKIEKGMDQANLLIQELAQASKRDIKLSASLVSELEALSDRILVIEKGLEEESKFVRELLSLCEELQGTTEQIALI